MDDGKSMEQSTSARCFLTEDEVLRDAFSKFTVLDR